MMAYGAKGLECPDCQATAAEAAAGPRWPAPAVGAAVLAGLALLFDLSWTTTTSGPGGTIVHAVHLGWLVLGPLAAIVGGLAAAPGLRDGARDRTTWVGALAVLIGAAQLLRGLLAL